MSIHVLSHISLWNSLVQARPKVMTGKIVSRIRLRLVSHRSRPVYCKTKTNKAGGTVTMPIYCILAIKILVDRSGLTLWRALRNAHSAVASIKINSVLAPGVDRLRQR